MRLPIFIPDTTIYNKNECLNLKFISSTGLIVSLPFDSKVRHRARFAALTRLLLQVPLARFIARCVSHHGLNGLTTLKCYQIGSVYREGIAEMHPRELTACDFDIVFTQSTYYDEGSSD